MMMTVMVITTISDYGDALMIMIKMELFITLLANDDGDDYD